jgi:transcriptional regulator with XRE-family HTH domain
MPVRFRLQALLDRTGVSQSQLARRSGVSFSEVHAIALNETARVDLATLDLLAGALRRELCGLRATDLLEDAPSPGT